GERRAMRLEFIGPAGARFAAIALDQAAAKVCQRNDSRLQLSDLGSRQVNGLLPAAHHPETVEDRADSAKRERRGAREQRQCQHRFEEDSAAALLSRTGSAAPMHHWLPVVSSAGSGGGAELRAWARRVRSVVAVDLDRSVEATPSRPSSLASDASSFCASAF